MDVDDELEEERRRMMADRSRRRASMSLSGSDLTAMAQFRSSMHAISDDDGDEKSDDEDDDDDDDLSEGEGEGDDDELSEDEDEAGDDEDEDDIYGNFQSDEEESEEESDEEYDDDYENADKDDLVYMLREAEQRVQQAAEFGQALLQQTELLKGENARLTQEREEAATQLEENEWRMDELETEKAHLQDMISTQQEEMRVQLERSSLTEGHDSPQPKLRERSVSSVQREEAISAEEEFQRKRAMAAELTAKELNSSLAELREREIELLDGKAAEVTARVAAEQEVREQKRALGRVEEEAGAKAAALEELQSSLETQRSTLEKEQRTKAHMETRLGMLAREMKDLRIFVNDPNKRDGVLKRLDALETQVTQASSLEAAEAAAAAAAAAPKRDLTVMVTKNELVQAAGRSKFSVSTIEELEAELIKKLQLSVAAIAIHSWDAELGAFIHAADLSDLPDRCKVQLQEREKLEAEAREVAQAEVSAIVANNEDDDSAAQEPEEAEDRPPTSEEDAKEIAKLREEVESLTAKLRTSRKEVTRLRKIQVAQEKEAGEKLAGEFEKKERAHRAKIIKMKELSRQKKLTRDCFQRWFQVAAGDKLSKAQAAVEAAKGSSSAELEAAEKKMAELMAAQEARLLAERSVAAAAMASTTVREVMIRNVELRGEHEVVGEEGSSFSIFRIEVIGSGGGKGMVTWEVARRYTEFVRLRKALTNTKEVARLKSKKQINNGGVEEKFPTRYSKGNMRSKASKVSGGEDGRRSEMLAAWLSAVVEKYAAVGPVREFLTDDGSANLIADVQAVRGKLLADGAKIEGSSLSAKIASCTLVRSLTTTDGKVGCRPPSEKSAFLVCVSRSISSDSPRPRGADADGSDNTQKKFYVLSSLTPPAMHGVQSVPGVASPSVVRQLDTFCSQCLGHPYVHRVQDITSTTDIYGKSKVLVLRDNVVRGSIRDLLMSETNPLRTFKEKYGGRTRADMKAGAPLELARLLLLAKQVLTAMCFLESIGVPSGHVHAGNVLMISDSRLVGEMESIAVTDFENGLLQLAHSRMGASSDEGGAGGAPDESEGGAVCAFGCLLYEMATGCQWEHTMAHIEACPASIRPVIEQCLAMSPVTPRGGSAAAPPEEDSEASILSLQSLLAAEPFDSVGLSDLHTSAFPTADELPALREQCLALRKALADPPSLEPEPEPDADDDSAASSAEAGGVSEGVPPEGGGGGGGGLRLKRQVSSFKEQDDYEGELSEEVEKLLASCCEDNTSKPPPDAVERLRRVASLPTGGVLTPWLAKRMGEGLESSTPVVVKTLQLTGKLLPTASAQFKRNLKAEAKTQIEGAKVRMWTTHSKAQRSAAQRSAAQ